MKPCAIKCRNLLKIIKFNTTSPCPSDIPLLLGEGKRER